MILIKAGDQEERVNSCVFERGNVRQPVITLTLALLTPPLLLSAALNAIETSGLSKEYTIGWRNQTRLLALDSLDLCVSQGQIFGFLGPNGAGKSTTIKLLLGLITPTSGSGTLLGQPIHDKSARERVGFLPEDPSFCSYLKAGEFLDLCGKVLHMDRSTRKKRIAETLEMVGLTAKAKTRIAEFSRGMLQRIGLAQALLNQPDLVVLDEPLNGLDPYGRKELKNILVEQKAVGKTVFFSSHILSDVQEMCDEVGILNRGRLVAHGRLQELLPAKNVILEVENLGLDTVTRLEPLASSISREEHRWKIRLHRPDRKDEAGAILRQAGIQSIEVHTTAETLDDFFFRRLEEDNRQRNAATASAQTALPT